MDDFELYEEWDQQFDSENLKNDVAGVESGNAERKEVPHDVYEVKITKLELIKSKTSGQPMLTCWFKIVAGDLKNQMIFMNQVINTANANARGFQLHKCNEFLRSLQTSLPVNFESFKQYSMLLMDIMEEVDGKREFQLNYSTEIKGGNTYNTYKIEKVFMIGDEAPF